MGVLEEGLLFVSLLWRAWCYIGYLRVLSFIDAMVKLWVEVLGTLDLGLPIQTVSCRLNVFSFEC